VSNADDPQPPAGGIDAIADALLPQGPTYPRVFGGYLLLKGIAQGGMGTVHLAKQGGTAERECVVKTLRQNHTQSKEHLRRFLDEARVVQRLEHRNICRTFDVGVVSNTPFLVMDWVSGRDLRAVQQAMADEEVTPAFALHVIHKVARALDYAHQLEDERTLEQLRIVHRDVSPQNVMVSFNGEVKLIDFGLAASTMKTEHTAAGSIMGKLAYMAPEQLREEKLDGRCDLFACGVMLYELLVHERYYAGLTQDETWERVAYGGHTPPKLHTIPEPLRVLVERACAHNKDDRFATCGEFAKSIHQQMQAIGDAFDNDRLATLTRRLFPDGDREEAQLLKANSAAHLSTAQASDARLPSPGGVPLLQDLDDDDEGERTEYVEGQTQRIQTLHAKLSEPGVDAHEALEEMSAPVPAANAQSKDKQLLLVGVLFMLLSFVVLGVLVVLLVKWL